MEQTIKPCPFCLPGDVMPVRFDPISQGENVYLCPNCGVFTFANKWNTRPLEDALAARVAELEAELNAISKSLYRMIEAANQRAVQMKPFLDMLEGK